MQDVFDKWAVFKVRVPCVALKCKNKQISNECNCQPQQKGIHTCRAAQLCCQHISVHLEGSLCSFENEVLRAELP